MREVFSSAYQFLRSSLNCHRTDAEIVDTNTEVNKDIAINRTFGQLALKLYEDGREDDYKHIMGELIHDMTAQDFRISDLQLGEEASQRLRDLSGLE